jgi:hypothetical protein
MADDSGNDEMRPPNRTSQYQAGAMGGGAGSERAGASPASRGPAPARAFLTDAIMGPASTIASPLSHPIPPHLPQVCHPHRTRRWCVVVRARSRGGERRAPSFLPSPSILTPHFFVLVPSFLVQDPGELEALWAKSRSFMRGDTGRGLRPDLVEGPEAEADDSPGSARARNAVAGVAAAAPRAAAAAAAPRRLTQGGTGSMAASSRTAASEGNSAPPGDVDEIDDYVPAHDGTGGVVSSPAAAATASAPAAGLGESGRRDPASLSPVPRPSVSPRPILVVPSLPTRRREPEGGGGPQRRRKQQQRQRERRRGRPQARHPLQQHRRERQPRRGRKPGREARPWQGGGHEGCVPTNGRPRASRSVCAFEEVLPPFSPTPAILPSRRSLFPPRRRRRHEGESHAGRPGPLPLCQPGSRRERKTWRFRRHVSARVGAQTNIQPPPPPSIPERAGPLPHQQEALSPRR